MDRTKEPGSNGEPLYQDIVTAMAESWDGPLPKIIGGRYGLSSKEFTPAHVAAVYNELSKAQPKPRFIVGIKDDVTFLSLDSDDDFSTEGDDVTRAVFFGLGSDGTVSANRSSVKIIGENTPMYSQGYFVYDSRKAGSITTSHVRFSPRPIKGSYLVHKANFVACHKFDFTERIDMLSMALPGATFLLNSPYGPDEVWDHLPCEMQKQIVEKKLKFYVVDAYKVAREAELGVRINTVMQTCFFKLANVIPPEEAISEIKAQVKAIYGKKGGGAIVDRNNAAIDMALAGLHEVKVLASVSSKFHMVPPVPDHAPAFVKDVLGMMIANRGDDLPVSAMPVDGTFPTGTTQYEKRSIAQEIPIWDPKICIQCGLCSLGCPHASIRMKVFEPSLLEKAPAGFKATDYKAKEYPGWKFVIQVAPDDCTGCGLCVDVCPAKDKTQVKHKAIDMEPKIPHLERERAGWDFFLTIPDVDRTKVKLDTVKGSQFLLPLFEFSGACAGCGETPYIKLITQLFGDRMLIGNATGCSSIYGGNLPCTPYTQTPEGKGPAWSNSLFEDCAEFGMGFRLAIDQQLQYCHALLAKLSGQLGDEIVKALINNKQETDAEIILQRSLVATLKQRLAAIGTPRCEGPGGLGRLPGPPQRVELRRRRLGLRHRFRRHGPRLRLRPRRQHPGARYGGLLQHGRPGLEVDSPRRGGQVRRGGQARPQEGPGHDRHGLRQRLRRPDRHGRQPGPCLEGHPRGRVVSRHVADHRLQPLHQLGHQHDHRHAVAEGSGELRLLAAVPLRSPRRNPSLPPGQQEADGRLQGVRHEGGAVQHPHAVQAGGCCPLVPPGPGRHQRALALLRAVGRRGPSRRQRRRRVRPLQPKLQMR